MPQVEFEACSDSTTEGKEITRRLPKGIAINRIIELEGALEVY